MNSYQNEFVGRGPSTHPYVVPGAGYMERFTREALSDMVEQVHSRYVRMNVEHLSYLPPVGHWHAAEVEDDEEGHSQLVMYGHYLSTRRAVDSTLSDGPPDALDGPDSISNVSVGIEPRNFEPEAWELLEAESPLPVHENAERSVLPLLTWVIAVPVTWGLARFMGSFLERLGQDAAGALVDWIKVHARRSRDSSRDAMVEVLFEVTQNLTVSAFIPFSPSANAAVDELRQGLEGLGPVASFAGWMTGSDHPDDIRVVGFFYKDGIWNLGWWATPDSACITKWFEDNCPDPKRFLGRPLFTAPKDEEPRQLS